MNYFEIRVYPNFEQIEILNKWFGVTRWIYNKSLAYIKTLKSVPIISELRIKRKLLLILGFLIYYRGSYDKKGKLETFRYTQNQRRLETRTKK